MLTLLMFTLAVVLAHGSPSEREPRWMPIGPPGGSVRALAADPRDAEKIYLGTPNGVLYRSDDGAQSWLRMSPGFPRCGCSLDEIVVDQDGVLYVGFREIDGRGGGIARSTDEGATFAVLKGLDGESVRALALVPSRPRWIAAGTSTGAFLSRNGGKSWARITPADDPNLRNVASLAFDPDDPSVLYVGTTHLAWKTPDGGATWEPIQRGMVEDSHVMTLSTDPLGRQSVYATACTGIYHSTNGGSSWTKLAGIPEASRRTPTFLQSPDDPNLLLAGTTAGLWVSENRGGTWRQATSKEIVVNAMLLRPDGTLLLGTEEEGVLRSPDRGRTWLDGNDGFTERFVSRVLFDREGNRVFVAVLGARPAGGVFVANSVRGPWTRAGEGLEGRQVLALAMMGGNVLAGTDDGIFVRAREAEAWTRLPTLIGTELHPRVSDLLALPSGRLLASTSAGMLRSADGGKTWKAAALGGAGEVTALARSPVDPATVLAATPSGIFRSEDDGDVWKLVSSELDGMSPHALAFLSSDGRSVLATTARGLFRSSDRGDTWQIVGGGIPHSDLTGLAVHPRSGAIFASDFTHGGIFRSVDGGSSWERLPTRGLVSDQIWLLAFDPDQPGQLIAAARAGGLHEMTAPIAATIPEGGAADPSGALTSNREPASGSGGDAFRSAGERAEPARPRGPASHD